jgi:hypothetical protein
VRTTTRTTTAKERETRGQTLRTHPPRVQVERLAALVGVQDLGKVALREEDAALEERVRGDARQPLAARDELGGQGGASKLGDELVVVDFTVGAACDVPRGDDLVGFWGVGWGEGVRSGRGACVALARAAARGNAGSASHRSAKRTCSWLLLACSSGCAAAAPLAAGAGSAISAALVDERERARAGGRGGERGQVLLLFARAPGWGGWGVGWWGAIVWLRVGAGKRRRALLDASGSIDAIGLCVCDAVARPTERERKAGGRVRPPS